MTELDDTIRETYAKAESQVPSGAGLVDRFHTRRDRTRKRRKTVGVVAIVVLAVIAVLVPVVASTTGVTDKVIVHEDQPGETDGPNDTPSASTSPSVSPSDHTSSSPSRRTSSPMSSAATPSDGLVPGRGLAVPVFPLTPQRLPQAMSIANVQSWDDSTLNLVSANGTFLTVTLARSNSFNRTDPAAVRAVDVGGQPGEIRVRGGQVVGGPLTRLTYQRKPGQWVEISFRGTMDDATMVAIANGLRDEPLTGVKAPFQFGLVPRDYKCGAVTSESVELTNPTHGHKVRVEFGEGAPTNMPERLGADQYQYRFTAGGKTVVVTTPSEPEFTSEKVVRFAKAIGVRG